MKNSEARLMKKAGMGFTGWLAILFIALKLVGVIQWSWLWVLAPLWIPLAITLGVAIMFVAIWGVIFLTTTAIAIIAGLLSSK